MVLEDAREKNHSICIQNAKSVLVVVQKEVTTLSAYRLPNAVLEDARGRNHGICIQIGKTVLVVAQKEVTIFVRLQIAQCGFGRCEGKKSQYFHTSCQICLLGISK